MSRMFIINVWRKNIFDIYVSEYGTAYITCHWILEIYIFLFINYLGKNTAFLQTIVFDLYIIIGLLLHVYW